MTQIEDAISTAVANGDLLKTAAANIRSLLASSSCPRVEASIAELVADNQWTELNNRFFKALSFGTSGLRGRTIGSVITKAENGSPTDTGRPEFPCVGTNAVNYGNLSRATQGLVRYLKIWAAETGLAARPRVVFAHDTRHFSREFAEYCAGIVTDLGCDAYLFDSQRPTPELSFAIRYLDAHSGVMHTASHNPSHDNGYKVYWNEGDPIISEVATGITKQFNAVESDTHQPIPEPDRGTLTIIGKEIDDAYLTKLEDLLLQPALLQQASDLKIVFTALHGTGGVHVPAVLTRLGFNFLTVPEQDQPDGRFPTVKSPNPENAEALSMGIKLATAEGADIVLATDPDCDRLGVAVRNKDGQLTLITGNQIGSLMAWYRIKTFCDLGIVNDTNKDHSILVKTFVTTPLQSTIADAYGIPWVDTLTGFKYIGGKQTKYEKSLPAEIRGHYRTLTTIQSRDAHLEHGKFFIFGGEESYGYLGADFIRDKDGNGAVIMFAEVAAWASSKGITIPELIDEMYSEFGYYDEFTINVEFPGAAGAQQMASIVSSYSENPPTEIDGSPVALIQNFGTTSIADREGDLIPRENMLLIDLEDGRRFAVRPSGTEPKMKFYLFANKRPEAGSTYTADELAAAKTEVAASLKSLESWIESDRALRLTS
ncbi:MAG: phospho-sugar mutase [Verrucomicrobiales bacterium]|nr:phospho-sugar mutase [Verrucomicrobiales bacterium]